MLFEFYGSNKYIIYVNNNSCVYSCLLDASKAFDLVHYGKLFKILISKDLPKSVIRLYFDCYLKQIYCVIWLDYPNILMFQME